MDIGRYELRPSGLKGTWSEGIRYLKDGIRYLDRSKIAMDYLDRSKIGATQIRWHLDSSFSCMNYRSDDGKTSVSVGFYSCLGRLQSLSSDLSRMEFARNVQNTGTKRESRTLRPLWETPLGTRSSNLFMLGVLVILSELQVLGCNSDVVGVNCGRKVTSRLRFAKNFEGNYGHPHENVHCNLEWAKSSER